MLLLSTSIVILAAVMLSWVPAQTRTPHGPVSLPGLTYLTDRERQDLHQGRTVVKLIDPAESTHLVVFAASQIDVTPQRFAERIRNSPKLWVGPKVPRTGAFANPVRMEDVARISLEQDDVRSLRRCRPGDCEVKLSRSEMARIQALTRSGTHEAAQHEFRRIVRDRIALYQRRGLSALEPFHDHDRAIAPGAAFSRLHSHADTMKRLAPELMDYLDKYQRRSLPPNSEELLYWLETVHPPKPTLQAWHVTMRRYPSDGIADVLVLSRQIFATHYINGALALTALVRDHSGRRYMVYLNRVSADGLTGLFSGIRRYFIERRVRSGARAAFDLMRQRIEARERDM
jgi:hypothetical protein